MGARPRSDAPTRRGFVAAGLVLLALVGGAVAASASSRGVPSDAVTTNEPMQVAGPGGEVVGSIPAAAWRSATEVGPPVRTFGTHGRQLQALAVYDGVELVGYYTTGDLGFVPLQVANDPAAMDELLDPPAGGS